MADEAEQVADILIGAGEAGTIVESTAVGLDTSPHGEGQARFPVHTGVHEGRLRLCPGMVVGDKVYTLKGDKSQIDKLAGERAIVTGGVKGETINVNSISTAKRK